MAVFQKTYNDLIFLGLQKRKGKNANNELSKLCLVKLPVSNFELDRYTRLCHKSVVDISDDFSS